MSLFVDTSMWYAAADFSDPDNRRAKGMLAAGEPLVTTDHILVEPGCCFAVESAARLPSGSGRDCGAGWL
jgi:predicted nucleic acid-binding protein